MVKLKDITGQRFGKVVVIKYIGQSKWLCKCDCGNQKIIDGRRLRKGDTKSCGCLSIEQAKINFKKNFYTHKQSKTRLYYIWKGIKSRCNNKNLPKYKIYGLRGIKVCNEWQKFEPFYNWAIKNGYKENLSIDRINVNGDYCPDNCRWVDMKTQQRNRQNNHLLTYKNETHCISEWAEMYNLKSSTLLARINRGWSIGKALNTKVI